MTAAGAVVLLTVKNPVVGYFGLAFFGFSTVIIAKRLLFRGGPVLVIDDAGFEYRGSSGGGKVPWEAVDQLSVRSIHGNEFVIVQVSDPSALDAARGPLQRALARLNRSFGDVSISDSTLSMNSCDIVEAMRARWQLAISDADIRKS